MKKNSLFLVALSLMFVTACSNEENVSKTDEAQEHAKNPISIEKKEALSADSEASNHQIFTLNDATFTVPASFKEIEKKEGLTTSYILFELGGSASFNLVVEDASQYEGLTLESYIETSNASTGYTYKSDRYYKMNGYRWNELVSAFNGLELHQSTITKDGLFYTFTYGAKPEEIHTYLEATEDVLKSVSLR